MLARQRIGVKELAQEKVVTVRMSKEEHDVLKTFSFHSGVSINDVMLRAMRQYLATQGTSHEFDDLLKKSRGRYRSAVEKMKEED